MEHLKDSISMDPTLYALIANVEPKVDLTDPDPEDDPFLFAEIHS
jgi:hypothetical protein